MGETRAAIFPGLRQERRTVTRENRVEAAKMIGSIDTTLDTPFTCRTITGVSCPPMSQPSTSPRGMPARDNVSACWRMIRRSCRGVVPMVFSRP